MTGIAVVHIGNPFLRKYLTKDASRRPEKRGGGGGKANALLLSLALIFGLRLSSMAPLTSLSSQHSGTENPAF